MASTFPLDDFDYSKQAQAGFDFFTYQQPGDVLAPHPDLFESELDSSLAGIDEGQLQLLTVDSLTVDSHDAYSFLRSDTPPRGPASAITESSHSSAYDSELYAPSYAHTQYSFPLDLEMDFQRIRVESDYQDYQQPQQVDAPLDFGSLPPTPPLSPPRAHAPQQKQHFPRTAYSDYGMPTRSIPGYYGYIHPPAGTVSPTHVTSQLPSLQMPQNQFHEEGGGKQDPRKKYQCPSCPRAFARAYNLKTHMGTHDPNRLKPHVCPHRACGRSFSRKHDLGRHIVSIHREDGAGSVVSHVSSKHSIGVEQGARLRCDTCGKSCVGRTLQCECVSAQVK